MKSWNDPEIHNIALNILFICHSDDDDDDDDDDYDDRDDHGTERKTNHIVSFSLTLEIRGISETMYLGFHFMASLIGCIRIYTQSNPA